MSSDSLLPSSESQSSPKHPVPKNRRRDKPQLSCTLCRRRKSASLSVYTISTKTLQRLKCDRAQPSCGTCASRGLSQSCTYVQPSNSSKDREKSSVESGSREIQARIDQLESLVVSLMSTLKTMSCQNCGTRSVMQDIVAKENEPLPNSFGRISLVNGGTGYVGNTHWCAILDSISELKEHFQIEEESKTDAVMAEEEQIVEGPELLLGRYKHATLEEILAGFPPRTAVDRLVSKYFQGIDMAPVVIHGPTFLKDYERFWEDQLKTPIMWIGLLFVMICLATRFEQFVGEAPRSHGLIQHYREKVVQCLILGKYTRAPPYTVETMLLYFACEHFNTNDTQLGPWLLLGITAQLAQRQGYHRDASLTPRISPFDGEMRRRTWSTIIDLDLIISSQVGLPRLLAASQTDTTLPRNLHDYDFSPNSTVLPPARPDTELTPMLYPRTRTRLLRFFALITDLPTTTSYTEILSHDETLRTFTIPLPLQLRPLALSLADPPHLLLYRIYLKLVTHKIMCILHRRYLSTHAKSKKACIEAALGIVELQKMLAAETKPGGTLEIVTWKISSLVRHEFLLAATILCLVLDCGSENEDKIITALQEVHAIWLLSSSTSREAQKAVKALGIVLGKATGHTPDSSVSQRESSIGAYSNPAEMPPATSTAGVDISINLSDAGIDPAFDWENWDSQFRMRGSGGTYFGIDPVEGMMRWEAV